ncbi:acyltransferase family protein [Tsukamurella sp. 8F]|uniref:acyltransferase family protein n=1 Tax=unclassified Tsukamurella TaxID=2633480 RepID=UPI0023B9767B|nr:MULTISPECIES: acyltransferase family protein [unclassified Tsukamurella]MDF0528769.1 acyltransferase family protein [Tsukamurella sp. 8J]MDF0586604.1 acyltransferase family protein [Tsukamurella sp. 8F]
MAAKTTTGFRADLDGLRGLAIALVACFHVWFGRVSGGVDVFLTLSGYFFIGSLLRHALASRDARVPMRDAVNPWPRLARLARRLLPALVAVLAAVSALTVLILPQTRWLTTAQQVVASLLYRQNWELAENSLDYTAADSSGSPLQHLWSMSVQGQFFVGMLLVGLAFAGAVKVWAPHARPAVIRTGFGVGIAVIAAVSLAWATSRVGVDQGWNYYDTLARVWEPLAGGLLAVWMPGRRVRPGARNAVGAAALGLIATCGWWLDGASSYPGPWALVPVLSTVALIWAGAGTTQPVVSRVLAHPWAVWLGSMAYALYLWHWPLLVFYLARRDVDSVGLVAGAAILAVSLMAAVMTKRFVEDPLRSGAPARGRHGTGADRRSAADLLATARSRSAPPDATRRRRHAAPASRPALPRTVRYSTAVAALLAVCAVAMPIGARVWENRVASISVDPAGLDPALYPGAAAMLTGVRPPRAKMQPGLLEASRDLPATSVNGDISNFEDARVQVGVYGDPKGTKTIALAGASHSEFWITALDQIGRESGIKITTYLKMGCPLALEPKPYVFGRYYPECGEWVDEVIRRLIDEKPDAVFTTSTRPRATTGDWTPESYVEVFRRLDAAGIPTLGMRDTPWPSTFQGKGVLSCLADKPPEECTTPRSWILSPGDPAAPATAQIPLLKSLQVTDAMCDAQVCYPVVGNVVAYHDLHHLTSTFVRTLVPELRRQMHDALPELIPAPT